MAQKKKKIITIKHNEKPKEFGIGNSIPEGITVDPREAGKAGGRIFVDSLIASNGGVGDEQIAAVGLTMKDLTDFHSHIVKILNSIIQHDGIRPQRQQARAAAMRLAGYLRIKELGGSLVNVLKSTHELPRFRSSAADALGMIHDKKLEKELLSFLDIEDETIVKSVATALQKIGTKKSLDSLKQRKVTAKSMPLQRALHNAIRIIEREELRKTKLKAWPSKGRLRSKSTIERNIIVNSENKLVVKK